MEQYEKLDFYLRKSSIRYLSSTRILFLFFFLGSYSYSSKLDPEHITWAAVNNWIQAYDTRQRERTLKFCNRIETVTIHGHYSCPLSTQKYAYTRYHRFKEGPCG